MTCPRCEGETSIVNRYSVEATRALVKLLGNVALRWRRRECRNCGHKFDTAEIGVPLLKQLVETAEA